MTNDDVPGVRCETNDQGVTMLAAEDVIAYLRYCGLTVFRQLVEKDPELTYIACELLETVADKFADTWIDYAREEAGL